MNKKERSGNKTVHRMKNGYTFPVTELNFLVHSLLY